MDTTLSETVTNEPSEPDAKCPPYNNSLTAVKFGKSKYYQQCIETYIKTHPSLTADTAYSYFNNGDLAWTKRTFTNHFWRIRNCLINQQISSPIQLTPTKEYKVRNPNTNDINNIIKQIQHVLHELGQRQDTAARQTRQTLLSALCDVDSNGQLQNECMIRHIHGSISNRLLPTIVNNRHTFNTTDTALLYNQQTCDKHTRKQYSHELDQHITDYWINNTTADPNTRRYRTLRDATGHKYKQYYQYLHCKYKELYAQWKQHATATLNVTKLCSLSYFMALKPCWIYKVKSGDYSLCMKCYNFEQMTKALLKKLSADNAHTFGNMSCINFNGLVMDAECVCSDCVQQEVTLNCLAKSPLRLINYLCCENGCKYPNIDCIENICTEPECGITKLQQLLSSQSILINDTASISYRQIIPISRVCANGKTRKVLANIPEQNSSAEFKHKYLSDLREFKVHFNCWIHQHQIRRDFVDKKFGCLPGNVGCCHFDFIHNINVDYSTMTNTMWADKDSVSYLVSYDRFRNEKNVICEESSHYFCDDKKHDWSAAISYIRRHIAFRLNAYRQKYQRRLDILVCYSDNGEFQCTAFLFKVAEIAAKQKIHILWCFTAPGHSKGKHDGEGHVIKTETRAAVDADKIWFDKRNEEYSAIITKHLKSQFNQSNQKQPFDRHFVSIPEQEITHKKAADVCGTLRGISKYFCFLLTDTKAVWYRKLACHCSNCMMGKWSACENSDVCGKWLCHQWKPKQRRPIRRSPSNDTHRSSSYQPQRTMQFAYNNNVHVPHPYGYNCLQ